MATLEISASVMQDLIKLWRAAIYRLSDVTKHLLNMHKQNNVTRIPAINFNFVLFFLDFSVENTCS